MEPPNEAQPILNPPPPGPEAPPPNQLLQLAENLDMEAGNCMYAQTTLKNHASTQRMYMLYNATKRENGSLDEPDLADKIVTRKRGINFLKAMLKRRKNCGALYYQNKGAFTTQFTRFLARQHQAGGNRLGLKYTDDAKCSPTDQRAWKHCIDRIFGRAERVAQCNRYVRRERSLLLCDFLNGRDNNNPMGEAYNSDFLVCAVGADLAQRSGSAFAMTLRNIKEVEVCEDNATIRVNFGIDNLKNREKGEELNFIASGKADDPDTLLYFLHRVLLQLTNKQCGLVSPNAGRYESCFDPLDDVPIASEQDVIDKEYITILDFLRREGNEEYSDKPLFNFATETRSDRASALARFRFAHYPEDFYIRFHCFRRGFFCEATLHTMRMHTCSLETAMRTATYLGGWKLKFQPETIYDAEGMIRRGVCVTSARRGLPQNWTHTYLSEPRYAHGFSKNPSVLDEENEDMLEREQAHTEAFVIRVACAGVSYTRRTAIEEDGLAVAEVKGVNALVTEALARFQLKRAREVEGHEMEEYEDKEEMERCSLGLTWLTDNLWPRLTKRREEALAYVEDNVVAMVGNGGEVDILLEGV